MVSPRPLAGEGQGVRAFCRGVAPLGGLSAETKTSHRIDPIELRDAHMGACHSGCQSHLEILSTRCGNGAYLDIHRRTTKMRGLGVRRNKELVT